MEEKELATTHLPLPEPARVRSSRVIQPATLHKRIIHPTIEITDGYKNYGYWRHWRPVLNNVNITVYEGEIYTLLGPQCCGKSSILNIILGFTKLTAGSVKVFGFDPGHELSGIPGIRVGYIPKSRGLYQNFTVNETLHYYGRLLGLEKEYIGERIYFLVKLLNLPPKEQQYIKSYPEGVQKQISFAIALLHEPELLILDEPCDGLDPKLTRSMWEHMKLLCREDKTILTTTQTCDEARWADRLGFMRDGQVLLEGNPRELLTRFKEKTLERLYCRTYISDPQKIREFEPEEDAPVVIIPRSSSAGFLYSGEETVEHIRQSVPREPRPRMHEPFKQIRDCYKKLKKWHVLLKRDFTLALRNYGWLLLFLVVPTLFLLLFCTAIGTDPHSLRVGSVNYEWNSFPCNQFKLVSCKLLTSVDQYIINIRHFDSEKEAFDAAKNLDILAILVINNTCTTYFEEFIADMMLGTQKKMPYPPIVLYLDTTSKIISSTIEFSISSAIKSVLLKSYKMQRGDDFSLEQFLMIENPIFGAANTPNVEHMAPGMALSFVFHIIAFVIAVRHVVYKHESIPSRSYLAGIKLVDEVFSCMLVGGLFAFIQALLMCLILYSMFEMTIIENIGNVLFIIILQIVCGISFGICLGTLCDATVAVGVCVVASFLLTMILGGVWAEDLLREVSRARWGEVPMLFDASQYID
ncbi:ABC transporter G family member 20-like [Photinus pyralis]|uniref:ABC transporter G family member 20-like n=1 Tax=Photinus pyralis TaxID=7054 RepID=UPI00126717ED|nr:ABC transporter G family member 20-like [Photinus pyralis]